VQVGGTWKLTAHSLGEVAQPKPSLGARQVEPASLLEEFLDRCHLASCDAYKRECATQPLRWCQRTLAGSCIRVPQNAPKQPSQRLRLVNATGKQTPEDPSSPSTTWCKSVDIDAAGDWSLCLRLLMAVVPLTVSRLVCSPSVLPALVALVVDGIAEGLQRCLARRDSRVPGFCRPGFPSGSE
jgi:hypothetical protein